QFPLSLRIKAKEHTQVFEKIVPIILDHVATFGEVSTLAEGGEYGYFFDDPIYTSDALLWKDEKDNARAIEKLEHVCARIAPLADSDFTAEVIKYALWDYATEVGRGSVLWPMRYALSGRDKSPDPFVLGSILGKETTLERINTAIKMLGV
ncbi:MAG: hypothetical protein WAZ40_02840, partial [Minisyncoccia bacterium]